MKRKREGDQGGVHLKLRKTAFGKWQGGRVGIKMRRTNGLWEANERLMDELMDPVKDLPEFDESFLRLIRPAVRKSRRERKNIPDDVPTPPPTSSSDDDLFEPVKKVKKKTFRKKK